MVRNSRPGSYRTSLNPIQKLQTLPHLEAAPTSSSPPAHNGDTSSLMDHWGDHSTQKRPRRCEAGAGAESLSHKHSIPSAFLKTRQPGSPLTEDTTCSFWPLIMDTTSWYQGLSSNLVHAPERLCVMWSPHVTTNAHLCCYVTDPSKTAATKTNHSCHGTPRTKSGSSSCPLLGRCRRNCDLFCHHSPG